MDHAVPFFLKLIDPHDFSKLLATADNKFPDLIEDNNYNGAGMGMGACH